MPPLQILRAKSCQLPHPYAVIRLIAVTNPKWPSTSRQCVFSVGKQKQSDKDKVLNRNHGERSFGKGLPGCGSGQVLPRSESKVPTIRSMKEGLIHQAHNPCPMKAQATESRRSQSTRFCQS